MKLIEAYMYVMYLYKGSKYTIKTTKNKDEYKLTNLYGTHWNLYIREIDDNSIIISDNGEGIKYLEGLGIDVEGGGVKKEITKIVDSMGLELSDSKCIFHEFKCKSSPDPFIVYKGLCEIKDFGKLYTKSKRIFENNREENK